MGELRKRGGHVPNLSPSVKALGGNSTLNMNILNDFASHLVAKLPENVQNQLGELTTTQTVQVGLGLVVLGHFYRSWKNRVRFGPERPFSLS